MVDDGEGSAVDGNGGVGIVWDSELWEWGCFHFSCWGMCMRGESHVFVMVGLTKEV